MGALSRESGLSYVVPASGRGAGPPGGVGDAPRLLLDLQVDAPHSIAVKFGNHRLSREGNKSRVALADTCPPDIGLRSSPTMLGLPILAQKS